MSGPSHVFLVISKLIIRNIRVNYISKRCRRCVPRHFRQQSNMPPKRKNVPSKKDEKESAKTKKKTKISDSKKGAKVKTSEPPPHKDESTKIASSNLDLLHYLTEESWRSLLKEEFSKDYFKNLTAQLSRDYAAEKEIFPPRELIFNALNAAPVDKVKIVILGQDPYHDNGQAMGMAFSVPRDFQPVPPSLKNMYKELAVDIPGFQIPSHGSLETWAQRGVLLLNATLTVEAHQPNSHSKYGWQKFTDSVITHISQDCRGVVFILWGGFAQKKEKLIDDSKHCVIKAAHPSPLSFNKFFGCKCFSKANDALVKMGRDPVNWSIV
ncbi:uncharacterized protein LOC106170306 [Lingula anatina]|uniref:Uracil-DNA glycosylase n=1 Tax=Lingula anatina TaxID=7574 RepID=A0A1S3J6W9_LINAN|nr:uncharacterized protein LOC106170306 [Lingula anatina]|eukprot:XP_013405579.1 uncharacterized protein LOC106170306 [Lingula anatina]